MQTKLFPSTVAEVQHKHMETLHSQTREGGDVTFLFGNLQLHLNFSLSDLL